MAVQEDVFGAVVDLDCPCCLRVSHIREGELASADRAGFGDGAGAEVHPAEQTGSGLVGRCSGDLACGACLDESSADDDREVVADAQCLVPVMGDVHGGDVQVGEHVLQEGPHLLTGWLVQRGQRLIEQEQAWPDGQGPGERDALAFAAAEGARRPVGQVADPDASQQRVGGGGVCRAAACPGAEPDVLPHRQVREQRRVLENEADAAPFRVKAGEFGAVEADLAAELLAKPADGLEQHGLAGSGRAEHDEHSAGRDGQVHRPEPE